MDHLATQLSLVSREIPHGDCCRRIIEDLANGSDRSIGFIAWAGMGWYIETSLQMRDTGTLIDLVATQRTLLPAQTVRRLV